MYEVKLYCVWSTTTQCMKHNYTMYEVQQYNVWSKTIQFVKYNYTMYEVQLYNVWSTTIQCMKYNYTMYEVQLYNLLQCFFAFREPRSISTNKYNLNNVFSQFPQNWFNYLNCA
jgi:hypothetical protein